MNALLTNVKETASPYTFTLSSTNPDAILPSLGLGALFANNQYVTIAIPLVILVSVAVWILLEKTKLGYELRATGCNKYAAQYCGMKEKRNICLLYTSTTRRATPWTGARWACWPWRWRAPP